MKQTFINIWQGVVLLGLILPTAAGRPVDKKNGIVTIPSRHSVDETVERLKSILQSKGITLFAIIDHSGEATRVGMKMPNTKLVIFGNPKAGTPLMLAAPSAAIDLPLKILVAEDARGGVWVAYNSPQYLKVRHGLPENLLANIAVASGRFRRASSRSTIGLIQGCEPRASCRGLDNTPRPTGAQCYGEHKYS